MVGEGGHRLTHVCFSFVCSFERIRRHAWRGFGPEMGGRVHDDDLLLCVCCEVN